jgi:glycosyltransferase involved in cell wall biosynthesis
VSNRVLMLCYYYPPVQTSGTARSVGFATLLPEFGWEPVVLTVRKPRDRWVALTQEPAPDVETHRTFEWDLTGLVNLLDGVASWLSRRVGRTLRHHCFREALAFPDSQTAWLSTMRGIRLATTCDVVYASCSPASSALSAVLIGKVTRKPVVLDFRDAWAYDHGTAISRRYLRALLRLERRVVGACDHLILNTDGARRLYVERYPDHQQKMSVLPNGYDRLIPAAGSLSSTFRIVHTGTFYGGRDPSPLIAALESVNDNSVEFLHVGEEYRPLETYAGPVRIVQTGIVSREEALAAMQSASALYLRQGFGNCIAVAAKTYEYLATGLPILCHAPEGDNSDVVRRYGHGSLVISEDRVDVMASWIRAKVTSNPRQVPQIDNEFRTRFDRRTLTKELARVFEVVSGRARVV